MLWEDEAGEARIKNYFRTVVKELRKTLLEADADDILVKRYNSYAIDPALLDCDSYRFLQGNREQSTSIDMITFCLRMGGIFHRAI